tara:strand:- start:5824 stop:8304 length:2481 start_codon:yes stop_codon:yes gene_type:complete
MKKQIYYVLIMVLLASFSVYNKTDIKELIVSKLEAYDTEYYPEKIYLHTDKPYYSLNESIWFTGYMINGITHLKSKKSMVMHVDLIDNKDSIMDSKKIYISKVTGAGDFKISKTWKPGTYLLRAYTNEMRNGNTDDFFQKEITVLATISTDSTNTSDKLIVNKKTNTTEDDYKIPRPEISFYPEGGYLIEGLNNKVVIKVTDLIFKNQKIEIQIHDNEENEIFSFSTIKFGLGLFMLTPEPGKTYTAIVDINGSIERYPLPKPLVKGYQISAFNNGTNIGIHVVSNLDIGLKGSFLVGHQRGKHLYNKLETSNKSNYKLNFPTQKLNDGLVHFTLFNSEGNPVAERLIYIENPTNIINLKVSLDKKKIKTREKITLKIDAKGLGEKTVASSLSMSIRDMQAIPQNNFTENIKTYLLLNSDLRGAIENPGYFFEKPNDPKRRYLLDLTMMTNGWRRFTWQSLLHEAPAERKYLLEKGLYIKGKTKALKKPYDDRSTATRLTFLGKVLHQESQQSDSLGHFKYGPYVFFDSIPTLIEARLYDFKSEKRKNRNIVILLDNSEPEKPKVKRKLVLKSNINDKDQLAAYLKISKYIEQVNLEYQQQMQMLDEVVIVGDKKDEEEIRNEEFDSRTLHGYSDKRVVTDDIIGADSYTIFDLLQRLAGVNVSGTSVSIRGGGSPSYYLDGMEIDSTFVESLYGSEIDFIDVLTGPDAAIYSNSANGIIAIYSKIGSNISSKNVKRKPGIIDFQAEGYYTTREFYAPDHINGFEEMSKADLRTTLHWEPNIRILPNNTAEVSFFSCDTRGDYIIDIQGISDTGIPIYNISTFTVE